MKLPLQERDAVQLERIAKELEQSSTVEHPVLAAGRLRRIADRLRSGALQEGTPAAGLKLVCLLSGESYPECDMKMGGCCGAPVSEVAFKHLPLALPPAETERLRAAANDVCTAWQAGKYALLNQAINGLAAALASEHPEEERTP